MKFIDILIEYNKESLYMTRTNSIKVTAYLSRPINSYLSQKETEIPSLFIKTVLQEDSNIINNNGKYICFINVIFMLFLLIDPFVQQQK